MPSTCIEITCHCTSLAQSLTLSSSNDQQQQTVKFCHTAAYRRLTGVLGASYISISGKPSKLEGSRRYHYQHRSGDDESDGESDEAVFYFCGVCGCHVFRERDGEWAVTTGVIVDSDGRTTAVRFGTHDEDLSIFLPRTAAFISPSQSTAKKEEEAAPGNHLPASCLCKTVSFVITRPNPLSHAPKSPFPDLMIPYATSSPQIPNPDDAKWWLRSSSRFLAGLCACRSCRLTSGFEIQSWAFVPRTNIHFLCPETPTEGGSLFPSTVSFLDLHEREILQGYQSSEGVVREFCPRCGATVFWHDRWRPELLDVSVGLLHHHNHDASGRAEGWRWLDWWTERVSFAEEAGRDRKGAFAEGAVELVGRLEEKLAQSQY